MKILKYIIPLFLTLFISGAAYASTIPQSPTLFETYLANSQGSADTTATLASVTLRDGSNLSGYTCITIDANTPSLEYECGTLSGTTLTVSVRGIDAVTGFTNIASLQFAHHRGADVKITDYPVVTQLANIFRNTDSIANVISYATSVATSTIAANRSNLADWGLVQDTALQGSGAIAANTTSKGYVQIATPIQIASSTGIGSTGAVLVISADNATSTYNSLTAPLKVVVTQNSGKIDQNFLSLASTTVIGNTPAFNIGKTEFVATSSTTFTLPSGVTQFHVRVVGAGGNGGGSADGGGGGGGGYTEGNVSTTTSVVLTIGSGGNASGNTSFGGVLTASAGGDGSAAGGSGQLGAGGGGGNGSGGSINMTGSDGQNGLFNSSGTSFSGNGGGSVLGGGGRGVSGSNGTPGGKYGGGGGGSTNSTGGTGASGAIIIDY